MSQTLIQRLEQAAEANRAIDEVIFELIHGRKRGVSTFEQYEPSEKLPAYTASIDAAVTLVPKGWTWSLTSAFAIDVYLTFHRKGPLAGVEKEVEAHDAVSMPIAICRAALKARGIQS